MKYLSVIAICSLLTACVGLSNKELLVEFIGQTTADLYSSDEADMAIASRYCRILVADRIYKAPQGLTEEGDVINGAKGVDELVNQDGGNAFKLKSMTWYEVTIGTQLVINFDTMNCGRAKNPEIGI